MHVCCGVLERVVEAVLFDWAFAADLSCLFDVGDVFVVFGEHEVCFAFAVGVFSPVSLVYIGLFRFVWLCHIRTVISALVGRFVLGVLCMGRTLR